MVVIINGEIVQDNDPRAIRMRRTGATGQTNSQTGGASRGPAGGARQPGSVNSLNQQQQQQQQQQQAGGTGGDDVGGPLGALAKMLGIEGKFVTIPPMLGMEERKVPMIVAILAGVLVFYLLFK